MTHPRVHDGGLLLALAKELDGADFWLFWSERLQPISSSKCTNDAYQS